MDDLQDRVGLSVNDTGTCAEIDTPLTQGGSRDVRRDLIALRIKHGADTPVGHRCSNLIEQIKALDKASDERLEIAKQIDKSIVELRELTK